MNQNKSNGAEPKKNGMNHFEQSQARRKFLSVLETLRFNALNNPVIDSNQASDNHQLLQMDGMYFCQLGIGIVFEKHFNGFQYQRFPYWHSEIVLIKKQNDLYVTAQLGASSLLKPKLPKLINQFLYDSLEMCGDSTREEFITKKCGAVLLRPLLPREFLKLPDYAKDYSDYHFEEFKEEK
jgi:hypothetical protein